MVSNKEISNLLGVSEALTNHVAIGIPSTYKVNIPHKPMQSVFVQIIEQAFVDMFGGASTAPLRGVYRADNGADVTEGILMVGAYMSDADLRLYARDIIELALLVKTLMRQESVAVIANGTMRFI